MRFCIKWEIFILFLFSIGRCLSVATKSFFLFIVISSPQRNKLPGEEMGVWDPSRANIVPLMMCVLKRVEPCLRRVLDGPDGWRHQYSSAQKS